MRILGKYTCMLNLSSFGRKRLGLEQAMQERGQANKRKMTPYLKGGSASNPETPSPTDFQLRLRRAALSCGLPK
jgi:hypothetical protein